MDILAILTLSMWHMGKMVTLVMDILAILTLSMW
jgi:hypothetical protein